MMIVLLSHHPPGVSLEVRLSTLFAPAYQGNQYDKESFNFEINFHSTDIGHYHINSKDPLCS